MDRSLEQGFHLILSFIQTLIKKYIEMFWRKSRLGGKQRLLIQLVKIHTFVQTLVSATLSEWWVLYVCKVFKYFKLIYGISTTVSHCKAGPLSLSLEYLHLMSHFSVLDGMTLGQGLMFLIKYEKICKSWRSNSLVRDGLLGHDCYSNWSPRGLWY